MTMSRWAWQRRAGSRRSKSLKKILSGVYFYQNTPSLGDHSWYIYRKKLEEAKELQKFRKKPAGVR
jgi:hypothetical protein